MTLTLLLAFMWERGGGRYAKETGGGVGGGDDWLSGCEQLLESWEREKFCSLVMSAVTTDE